MSDVSIEQNQDQGSFVTGFAVGMLAGAVGYYLFGTKKGGKLLVTLQDEWQRAKQEIIKSEPFSQSQTSVLESVRNWIDTFSQAVGAVQTSASRQNRHASYKDVKTKKTVKKFKGT